MAKIRILTPENLVLRIDFIGDKDWLITNI
jgi:hypothetical protein